MFLLVQLALTLLAVGHGMGREPVRVNGSVTITDTITSGLIHTISLDIRGDTQKALRISTYSSDVNMSTSPLHVAVRQGKAITSWSLPHVESGIAFSMFERTLCSYYNDDQSHMIYIDVSTPSTSNITYLIMAMFVDDYQLQLDTPINTSVSSPVYYKFQYPSDVDSVLVKVSSSDGPSPCAIVSVQDTLCPNDMLIDYPEHRGIYQTMQTLAAIYHKRPSHQDYFYVVISSYRHDDCSLANHHLIDGLVTLDESANLNPLFVRNDSWMLKNITIAIDHTLPVEQYWVGVASLGGVLLVFCIIVVMWAIIDGCCCYRFHPAYKLFMELEVKESDVENGRSNSSMLLPVKRPAFLSVIKGTHWLDEIERRTTPSPKSPDFINHEFARALDKVNPVTNNVPIATNPFSHPNRPLMLPTIPSDVAFPVINDDDDDDAINIDTSSIDSSSSVGLQIVMDTSGCDPEDNKTQMTNEITRAQSQIITTTTNNKSEPPVDANVPLSVYRCKSMNKSEFSVIFDLSNSPPSSAVKAEHKVDDHDHKHKSDNHQHADMKNRRYLIMSDQHYINQVMNYPSSTSTGNTTTTGNTTSSSSSVSSYWVYLIAIFIFYSIPSYQLLLTYQRFVQVTGNGDLCYYNTLCSHPVGFISAFNNIWSNVGFLVLGVLFLIIAIRRRRMYKFYQAINEYYDKEGKPEAKLGIPQEFGIYYGAGIALILEAFLSAAYHFCPTGSNYQFDTTMMYILVTLGLYQFNMSRNPDIHPSPHRLLLTLSLMILVAGMGVLYAGLIFYIIFFILYEVAVIYTTLQIYYRWKLHLYPLHSLLTVLKELLYNIIHPCPPQHKLKFTYLIISNIINLIFSIGGLILQPVDFGTYFLALLIGNFVLSLAYYTLAKVCYKEFGRKLAILKSVIYLILALLFWAGGVFVYSWRVTDWLKSPAGSRDDNSQCILLGFYDTHDMWHFLSSFGIFFSFMLLMTLDDNQEFLNRSKLHVF